MDYAERCPTAELAGLVKCRWTITGHGGGDTWREQHATPDGCMELIQRHTGRSWWGVPQPGTFVVGLVDGPQAFKYTGDASFSGLRLWPWAWTLIDATPPASIYGRWQAHGPFDVDAIEQRLARAPALAAVGRAIMSAHSVAQMRERSGMTSRALQRWFAAKVGVTPRHYLRLLRFQRSFASLPTDGTIARHAAERGFADQAHMTREFRAFAGATPDKARRASWGPFFG